MLVADTFKALGDPVRLQMIQRLSQSTQYTVGSLSAGLGLTRQGARKHLQLLADAELVSLQPRGRQTKVTLDATTLAHAKRFITELELQWDQRLLALKDFVENDVPTKQTNT
ncbi:MAG: HTH-type transcriptional regulator [Candidatus Saccharibacteria bacterium]|nr:HTH-type transcriptional regulator [Candidatus Saccharibacteria bacterium]